MKKLSIKLVIFLITASLLLLVTACPKISVSVTIQTIPVSTELKVDGVDYVSPVTLEMKINDNCAIQIMEKTADDSNAVSGDDVKYSFYRWNDGVTSNPRTVKISDNTTYIAELKSEYKVETGASPAGVATIAGAGWYEADINHTFTAPTVTGYTFDHWEVNGSNAGTNKQLSLAIDTPKRIIAVYTQNAIYSLTVTTTPDTGLEVQINGTNYTAPKTMSFEEGETVNIGVTSPQEKDKSSYVTTGTDTRYTFNQWNDGNTKKTRTITINSDKTYTAEMEKEYKVETGTSPAGVATIAGAGWYEADINHTFTVPTVTGYVFDHWEVNGVNMGSNSSLNLTIDLPKKVVAVYNVNISVLKIWNLSDNPPDNSGPIYSSPVMDASADVYVGSQTNLYRFESSTDYTTGYYEFSSSTAEIWGSPTVDYSSGYLYVGNKDGDFLFFDTSSESGYWIFLSYSYSLNTTPIIYGDYIYIIDYLGELYVISKSGHYLNSMTITDGSSRIWSDPIRYGEMLFIATNDGEIIAFNLDTNSETWHKFTHDSFYGGMALDRFGNLYIAGESLYSYTSNGNLRWSLTLDSQAYANPVISSKGELYIGTIGGKFYSIDTLDGSVNWVVDGLGSILSSALIAEDGIIYFAGGTYLIAMDKATGEILGSIELDNFVESNPILHDHRLFIGTESGSIYILDVPSSTIEYGVDYNWPMFQRNWYHTGSIM